MSTPDAYWLSATSYARLAAEMERAGHFDLERYFLARAVDAAVARFDEVCAVPQLVAVDVVPEERTQEMPAANPWIEQEVRA